MTNLQNATLCDVNKSQFSMAILPWGALEPHNFHLPYYTDCLLAQAIAIDAVQASGCPVGILPPIWLGQQNPSQTDYPFCIHTRVETQKAILTDIVRSLQKQSIRKLLIINGHGGNTFKGIIRDIAFDHPDFMILTTDWYAIVPRENYFDNDGEHADELETSVLMHYYPQLVDLSKAGTGASQSFALQSLNNKTAWLPRVWRSVTNDTGIGNPANSSPEKGEKYAKQVVKQLAQLIQELNTNHDIYKIDLQI